MEKYENNSFLGIEVKPNNKEQHIDDNLETIEGRIEQYLEKINKKMYSYEKNKNGNFYIVVNGIKYDSKEYRNAEELISAMKLIYNILKIYKENGSKNEFYLKNDGFGFIDIYLDDSIIPFGDTKYLIQESFTKHFGEKQDIEKFVNFLNQVIKTL